MANFCISFFFLSASKKGNQEVVFMLIESIIEFIYQRGGIVKSRTDLKNAYDPQIFKMRGKIPPSIGDSDSISSEDGQFPEGKKNGGPWGYGPPR